MKRQFGNFDTYTYSGAQQLCQLIRKYWAAQGKIVSVEPVELPRHSKLDGTVWGISSNIKINRFDAEIPASVQRITPVETRKTMNKKPRKEAA